MRFIERCSRNHRSHRRLLDLGEELSIVEFEVEPYYTGPTLTDVMVVQVEASLGYPLPAAYIELLRVQNGGVPIRRCLRTTFETSWAPNYFEIAGILGIGFRGIENSAYMIKEWGYPDIGIVFCDMPSGGHDAVMLDYRGGRPEPEVAYVDEDRVPRVVAPTFLDFVQRLERVVAE